RDPLVTGVQTCALPISAAKLMIEMRNVQLPLERLGKPLQNVEQDHRIYPARNGNQHVLSSRKKITLPNRRLDLLNNSVHALTSKIGRASCRERVYVRTA